MVLSRSYALIFRYYGSKALSTEVCGSLIRRTSMVNGFHHNYFANKLQIGLRHLSSRDLQAHISPEIFKIMEQRLSLIELKAASLHALMDKPEVSPSEFAAVNKELTRLRPFLDLIQHLRANHKEINGLKSLLSECSEDKDIFDLASEELGHAIDEENKLRMLLLKSLLPKDDADERDCILEVRAGTGGEEASLFAMEIFKMYERYSQKNGWKFEVVDINQSDLKGFKNKAKALKVLCARLYELERCRSQANRSKLRAEQIGSGDRSERIRTYNFPQGRVTDHRVGITCHSIDEVLLGESLDMFIDALLLQQEIDAIASFSSN